MWSEFGLDPPQSRARTIVRSASSFQYETPPEQDVGELEDNFGNPAHLSTRMGQRTEQIQADLFEEHFLDTGALLRQHEEQTTTQASSSAHLQTTYTDDASPGKICTARLLNVTFCNVLSVSAAGGATDTELSDHIDSCSKKALKTTDGKRICSHDCKRHLLHSNAFAVYQLDCSLKD